jgi:hypothetical protein
MMKTEQSSQIREPKETGQWSVVRPMAEVKTRLLVRHFMEIAREPMTAMSKPASLELS